MNIDALEKLQQLKEKGIISENEFYQLKNNILTEENNIKNNYHPISGCAIWFLILIILVVIFCKFILILFFQLNSLI